jgi:glucokinase
LKPFYNIYFHLYAGADFHFICEKEKGVKMPQLGLIADIGATNARFALADRDGIYDEKVLKCADYPGILEAIKAYIEIVSPARPLVAASVAIAGPVSGDYFEMTNHPWAFSQSEVQKALGLQSFHLMNDFKAIALAVPALHAKDVRQFGGGQVVVHQPIGVIGPGTGLGVASLVWADDKYIAVPGEGGHVTMPARTLREFELFKTLIDQKYTHISAERVCSGKGLVNLYNAMRVLEKRADLPDLTPEEISAKAIDKSCAICVEIKDFMTCFLARIAGNLALTLGAGSGVYIAGGIVGRWGAHFDKEMFREEFESKGRFRDYMKAIPTFIIEHDFPAFVGLQADLVQKMKS